MSTASAVSSVGVRYSMLRLPAAMLRAL